MRKSIFFALAAIALTAAACTVQNQKEEPAPAQSEGQEMVFHAVCGDEADLSSRTARQADGKVFWSPNDVIAVFQGTMYEGAIFTSTNVTESPTADFTGTLPSGSGGYWAVYPYSEEAWCPGNYVVTDFTNEQTAVPGTFADDLFISVAYSETTTLSFTHPLGGVKFSVVSSGIKKVTLKANNGESIATNLMAIDVNSNGKAFVGAIDEGYDYIELAPENGGSFIPGEDYYFITLPTTMSKGFTLLFEREDGKIFTRNVNTSVAMSRAMFRYLPNADTEGEWVTPQLTFSPSEINIGALGGSFSIDVTYFGTPHVDASSCDWISVTGSSGDPKFGCSYFFHVEPNTGSERVGVITICSDENCYPVMVTQADGSSVQRLKHHSLGMRFTATWCGYCPRMNKSFAQVHSDLGDKFNIVNFHATSSNLPFSGTPTLMSQYSIGGYPTGIVDGRALIKNYNISYTVSLIKQAIQETEDNYPTTTSVGISSSLSGQTLSVDVNVFALEAGTYKITALLLENGIVSPQTDYDENTTHNDYVHNNTARMSLSPISGTLFDVTSANSNTQFNYNVTVPTTYDKNNLSILVYIQKPFGNQAVLQSDNYGDYYVDNSRIVPVGETTTTEFE